MEMIEGNLWKQIFKFSLPLVLTNLLQVLFNIADVAVVGKFAGPISLGAVGSTTLLISLTTGWLIGVSNGVNSVVAFYIGARDDYKVRNSVQTGFVICLGVGIVTFLIGTFFARPVLTLLGTKPELIEEALVYFKIYMTGSPALAVFNFGNSVLSAEGDTRKPLKYLTISGILNVALNLLFVIGFHRTSDGVAYASIISQYLSAFLIVVELVGVKDSYRLSFNDFGVERRIASRILGIGVPSALQGSLFAVANLVIQSAVNTFDHVVVEGNSAAMNFDSVVYQMMAAFYVASTSFIAQNYGAGNRERVKKTYLITTAYSFGLAAVLGGLIDVFKYPLLGIFTNDADVIAMGAIRVGIISLSYCLSAFMDNAVAACRGLGKTVVPTVIVLMGTIVFRVIWVYTVFAYFGTLQSLYWLYACAFVITSVFLNIYFFDIYRSVFKSSKAV